MQGESRVGGRRMTARQRDKETEDGGTGRKKGERTYVQ
jgi:hypothetical protein